MINTYNFIYLYQKTVKNALILMGASNGIPCPLHQAITCHLLQYLSCKVQKKVFVYLFPIHYNESLYQQNFMHYGPSIANRGRDELRSKYPDRFKVLNKAIASTITLLLLKPFKWSALNQLILVQYLFSIRVSIVQTALKILIFILQKTHQLVQNLQQTIHVFFKPNPIPKPSALVKKNGNRIKELLAELEEKFPNVLEDLEQSTDLLDWVTHEIPIYPVKEKAVEKTEIPQHFWDIETIKNLFTQSSTPNCPNGCGKKLELENEVDTNSQTKIIELLEKIYNFAILPFNKDKLKS